MVLPFSAERDNAGREIAEHISVIRSGDRIPPVVCTIAWSVGRGAVLRFVSRLNNPTTRFRTKKTTFAKKNRQKECVVGLDKRVVVLTW